MYFEGVPEVNGVQGNAVNFTMETLEYDNWATREHDIWGLKFYGLQVAETLNLQIAICSVSKTVWVWL